MTAQAPIAPPKDSAKARPVIMLVTATITDWTGYQRYMDALVASRLIEVFGGTPLATGSSVELLEGIDDDRVIAAIVEFPSAAAAHDFWNCDEYRKICDLRHGVGDFQVALWRKLPTRVG